MILILIYNLFGQRRGPIAAEFKTPSPAAILLPSTFGKSRCAFYFYNLKNKSFITFNLSTCENRC